MAAGVPQMLFPHLVKTIQKLSVSPLTYLCLLIVILSWTLIRFSWKYTVNIPMWDQWDIVYEVINPTDITTLFSHQHGDHRIGTALVYMHALAWLTNWDIRLETATTIILLSLACFSLLWTKKKLFQQLDLFDVIVPLLVLNAHQWENLMWGFQIAFILPAFFLYLSLPLLSVKPTPKTGLGLIIISILATYSSFHGLIVAGLIGGFFLLYGLKSFQTSRSLAYRHFLFGAVSFLIASSYYFNLNLDRTTNIKNHHILSIGQYIFFQLNSLNLYQKYDWRLFVIPLILLILFGLTLKVAIRTQRVLRLYPLFSLYLYTFGFSLATAFGRSDAGFLQGQASRYVTHLIPVFIGAYFSLRLILTSKVKTHPLVFMAVLLAMFFWSKTWILSQASMVNYTDPLRHWKDCYLQFLDVTKCERTVGSVVYPYPKGTQMKEKLQRLEKIKYNLFYYR